MANSNVTKYYVPRNLIIWVTTTNTMLPLAAASFFPPLYNYCFDFDKNRCLVVLAKTNQFRPYFPDIICAVSLQQFLVNQ